MNELLREIAVKAQVEHCISHVRLKEFAELIVRECMELVEGYTKQRTHTTFYKAEEQIKQHFGVEE